MVPEEGPEQEEPDEEEVAVAPPMKKRSDCNINPFQRQRSTLRTGFCRPKNGEHLRIQRDQSLKTN